MGQNQHVPMEEMEVFRRYVVIADWVWDVVGEWPALAQETVGEQLIRATDSVGANLVEGDGRYSIGDAIRFFVIARASARETRYWLERGTMRKLVGETEGQAKIAELTGATQLLNRLIAYRRSRAKNDRISEVRPAYEVLDAAPFTAEWPLNT